MTFSSKKYAQAVGCHLKIKFPMLFHTKKSSDRMVKEELPNHPFRGIIS